MGVETAILAGLSAGANYKAQRDKRKSQKRNHRQQQQLLDHQLGERTKELETDRKQRAANLRARYGASGLRPNSRSALGLLQSLNTRTDEEIESLRTVRRLRSPNLLSDNNYGHVTGLLRNLQNIGG